MPVIVLASPKGGSGKSTTAVILGTELAEAGVNVVMMDCDPNKSLTRWATKESQPNENIKVLTDVNEKNIIPEIDSADQDGVFVIIDLEGIASVILTKAASRADLIITPMQPKQLDAEIGLQAVAMVKDQEETLRRKIKHSVVLTMTKGIGSRQQTAIRNGLLGAGIHMLNPDLMERSAFDGLFKFGGGLRELPKLGNMENAIENAASFTQSVINRLGDE